MKKMALAVACLMLASGAQASPLTCAKFKERLTNAIVAAGHKVALPRNFEVKFRAPGSTATIPETRYAWEGIEGLTEGGLQCDAGDSFHSFSFVTAIGGEVDSNMSLRLERAQSLIAAAISASSAFTNKQAKAFAIRIAQKALNELDSEVKRGEMTPSGTFFENFEKDALQLEVTAHPDNIYYSVTQQQ